MNHPYQTYIETKAADYYGRKSHESFCEVLNPPGVPTNERTGETYDVYIIPYCDCWIAENFDNLTLARKFDALRDLSHRYGLHSPVCSRLKRTPSTYRGRPEVMTGWCDCWLSVDFRPDSPVEYEHSQPTPTKGHTMNALTTAIDLSAARDRAQQDIEAHLAPFLTRYKEFLLELNPPYDSRDLEADTFDEIDNKTFYFTGEEDYKYGEYYTPSLSLPFAFVEDPEAFKADYLKTQAETKAKAAAKAKTAKEEQIARLEAQLAKVRAELEKAEADGTDPIKITATRNQLAKATETGRL